MRALNTPPRETPRRQPNYFRREHRVTPPLMITLPPQRFAAQNVAAFLNGPNPDCRLANPSRERHAAPP